MKKILAKCIISSTTAGGLHYSILYAVLETSYSTKVLDTKEGRSQLTLQTVTWKT